MKWLSMKYMQNEKTFDVVHVYERAFDEMALDEMVVNKMALKKTFNERVVDELSVE